MRASRWAACAIGLAAIVMSGAVVEAQEPLLAPHRFIESFEGGSVGAWSSYPPAQDTAYDPTIWVKPLAAEGEVPSRALYREITPLNPVDYAFGVRKLLHMHVDRTSVLTFRAYIDASNGAAGVRLRFGFADGSDETVTVPVSVTRQWVQGRVELDGVVGPGPPRELTAVAFIALCPDADPGAPYRFGLDDVTLTGWRPPSWTFVEPPAHELVELRETVAGRHFQEDGVLRLEVRAPAPAETPRLRFSRALTGGDARTIEMVGAGQVWRGEITLSSSAGVGAGLWRATLDADTTDGRRTSSSLVFLMRRADAPTEHPRLLLGPGDAGPVLARAASGHLRDVWAHIQAEAARLRQEHDWRDFSYNFDAYDAVHWLPTLSGYATTLRTVGRYIRDNERDVVWLAPRTVLLVDRAVGAGPIRRINLRFHAPHLRDIQVDGRSARVDRPNAGLALRALAPADARWEIHGWPVTLDELGQEDAVTLAARGFLQLDADLGTEPVTLVTLLSAGRAPATATIQEDGSDHLTLAIDGRRYIVNRRPGAELLADGVRTDARLYATGTPDELLIVGALRASRDGDRLLLADAAVSVSVNGTGVVSMSTAEASRVELSLDREPRQVLVNGVATDRWTYDRASGLSVTISARPAVP